MVVTRKDLIKQVFDLNKTEYLVFKTISENVGKTPISIKKLVGKIPNKDRSTIQKIIKILMNKGLIKKRQQNLDRGFRFLYETINEELILLSVEKYYRALEYERTQVISRWKLYLENK